MDDTFEGLFEGLFDFLGEAARFLLYMGIAMAVIWVISKIAMPIIYFRVDQKMKRYGTKSVEVVKVNSKTVDDTFDRAALGYMIAGEKGWFFGAMTGQKYEKIDSVTFKIFYGNNTEQTITCPVDHWLCEKLMGKAGY